MQDRQNIRDIIFDYGFSAVGIAPYAILSEDRARLADWLSRGNQAAKAYLERNDREDPRLLLAGCRSVVVALFAPQRQGYHNPIRKSLKRLLKTIQDAHPDVKGRAVVDTAPIFEKSWAVRAGLGSVGLNTLLINPKLGSDFNIGILLLDVELPYDVPFDKQLCDDSCALCLDACPSGALNGDRTLDCRICLSYLSQIAAHGTPYGCTICQQACPFNSQRAPLSVSAVDESR